jgi:hypothetical protein
MKIENGKVVFERKDCWQCNKGQKARIIPCPECKGTGRGKRGGARGCKKCNGFRTSCSWDDPVPCDACQGNYQNHEPEDATDYLPAGAFASLTFKVYRVTREMTWGESHIGLGCVYSCTDYGRSNAATDDAIIADVKNHSGVQACKVIDAQGNLCDHIGIFVRQGGYTVKAVFN